MCLALTLLAMFGVSCGGRRQQVGADASETELSFPGAPVILISIDTLRSDHLPVYGYRGVETPNIDGLRAESVLFSRAYSHSPLTLPSHVSILTGVLPADHGVRNNLGFTFDGVRHPTIPSLLEAGGYVTGAAVSAYVLRAGTGLGPLFDVYDDDFLIAGEGAGAALERVGRDTVKAAQSWIGEHADQPLFYFLHLFEPHTPYDPPEPFASRYPLAYDGEIATADADVGDFLAFLKQMGLYDRAIIVLLSDHGEGLGDHGEAEHGIFLYREAIQVPLIIRLPGGALGATTVDQPVQLIDVLPTVTRLVGIEPPPDERGRSLFGRPAGDAASRAIIAETWVPRIHFGWSELWSLIDGRHHLISAPRPELFDVVADPAEENDLIEELPVEAERLAAVLAPEVRPLEEAPNIDPVDADRLRALGYVGEVAATPAGPLADPKDRIETLHLLNEATGLAAAGNTAKAVARLQELVAANPGFTAGWLQLATISHSSGRLEEAISAYKETIKLDPSLTAKCGAALAAIHQGLRRWDEAEVWARRCIAAGSAAGHLQLGRIEFARGNLTAAESEARLAMEDPLHRVVGAVFLAEVLAGQGRVDEALGLVEAADEELEAQHLDPVPRLHLVRGDLMGRLERFDEAERDFLTEIAWYPENLTAYTNLAVVYYVTRRVDQARSTLERMVEANPNPISLFVAARTCREIGDTEAAAVWQQRIDAQR